MNYQEFISHIQEQIRAKIDPAFSIQIQQIHKNNGLQYDALVILCPTLNISPTIYLTPYYHRYLDGVSLTDICEDILDTYHKHVPHDNFDLSLFTDLDKASPTITYRLVNYERNKALLAQVPHKRYLDLAIVYYCMLEVSQEQLSSILIHNEHLQQWNISLDALHQLASANTPHLFPYEINHMTHYLEPILGSMDAEALPAYVLTNAFRTNGAACILYDNLLDFCCTQLDCDLLIIPSSIHEVLLIPLDGAEDFEHLNQLVQEVNDTQLSDEEILSDHVYCYFRHGSVISCQNTLATPLVQQV